MTNDGLLTALAEALCNNAEARFVANREDAPAFIDSERYVQEYWRIIARAVVRTLRDLGPSEEMYALLRDESAVPENITAVVFNMALTSLIGRAK